MRIFTIKAFKFRPDDKFCMLSPTGDFIEFACFGLSDLYKTLRTITPKGYRVPKGATLGKRVASWHPQPLTGYSMFKTKMTEIIEVKSYPIIEREISYINNFGFTHILKVVKQ